MLGERRSTVATCRRSCSRPWPPRPPESTSVGGSRRRCRATLGAVHRDSATTAFDARRRTRRSDVATTRPSTYALAELDRVLAESRRCLSCRPARSRSCSPTSRARRALGGAPRRDAGRAGAPRRDPPRRRSSARRPRREDDRRRRPRGVRRLPTTRVAAASTRSARSAPRAWARPGALRVRMGLHTGAAELRDGDYYGTAVNRAARLMARRRTAARSWCRTRPRSCVRDDLPAGVELRRPRRAPAARPRARPSGSSRSSRPGLPAEFPPLRSLDAFPGNLPAQLTSFVGRDDELDGDREARSTSARLVTLTGVGGVGKTRLALQVAAEVLPRLPRRRVALRARGGRRRRRDGRRSSRATLGVQPAAGHVARARASSSSSRAKRAAPRARQLRAPARRGRPTRRARPARLPAACGSWRRAARASASTGEQMSAAALARRCPSRPTTRRSRDRRGRSCSSSAPPRRAPTSRSMRPNAGSGRRDLPPPRRHPARHRARRGARRRR